jgi:hypothetical protein
MSTDPQRMLRAQTQFIEKHYGAPGCGFVARRIAFSHCYKQRADALWIRQQPWAALQSALRALILYPLEMSNLRTAGSMLLRCLSGRYTRNG